MPKQKATFVCEVSFSLEAQEAQVSSGTALTVWPFSGRGFVLHERASYFKISFDERNFSKV